MSDRLTLVTSLTNVQENPWSILWLCSGILLFFFNSNHSSRRPLTSSFILFTWIYPTMFFSMSLYPVVAEHPKSLHPTFCPLVYQLLVHRTSSFLWVSWVSFDSPPMYKICTFQPSWFYVYKYHHIDI